MEQKSQKILGIDPGTAILGWGLIQKEKSRITPLKYGCIRTDSKMARADRLAHILTSISAIIEKEKPDEAAVEELFFFKNQKTVIPVAEARGVILAALRKLNVSVFEYTPLQVKQALTGYGRADKAQMQEMVKLTCNLRECPKPDDAADALAIAICHAQTNRDLSHRVMIKKSEIQVEIKKLHF